MQTDLFFERFDEIIGQPKRITLVCHVNPDGDAIGSMLAMSMFLKKKGHLINMVCPNSFPGFLAWMPGAHEVLVFEKEDEACKAAIASAECIIMLDFNSLSRSGVLHNEIGKTRCPRIMIDHHVNPELNNIYCYYSDNCVSSASEIVAEIILHYGKDCIDEGIATNLLVGMMTDTGCFSHSIYHPRTFEICGIMVEKAISYNQIHQLVYDGFTESRLRLLGYSINQKMEVLKDYAVAIIALDKNELKEYDYQTGDTEGVVNFPLSIKRIKMSVLVTERQDQIRLSFRSKGDFSVHELANRHFKGGGHRNAAGGSTTTTLEATISLLKSVVSEYEDLRYED